MTFIKLFILFFSFSLEFDLISPSFAWKYENTDMHN